MSEQLYELARTTELKSGSVISYNGNRYHIVINKVSTDGIGFRAPPRITT